MIVYFIQAHRHPEQVLNLVDVLLACPQSFVIVSYDTALPDALRSDRANYLARATTRKIHRGDFSPVDEYLDALRWLRDTGVAYDWFVNLCGQTLPAQPIRTVSREIADCTFDAVMHHFPMFSPASAWPERECGVRVRYRYRKLIDRPMTLPERAAVKCLKLANAIQPWVRINTGYGLLLGTRTRCPEPLVFHGGSYFKYLSRACGEFLLDYCVRKPAVVDFFRHSLVPDEIFTQTILLNHSFRISGDSRMFVHFAGAKGGHPKVLEPADLAAMAGWHFARKFDFGSPAHTQMLARAGNG